MNSETLVTHHKEDSWNIPDEIMNLSEEELEEKIKALADKIRQNEMAIVV